MDDPNNPVKILIVVAEGESEESFARNILLPYLRERCGRIGFKSINEGGISNYSKVKRDLIRLVYQANTVVTTMIDFYRLPSKFPWMEEFYKSKKRYSNKTDLEWVELVEAGIKEEIKKEKGRDFANLFPYIQLHEFEALIFSSPHGVKKLFEPDRANFKEFQRTIDKYENPEEINNNPTSVPSVRIKKIISGYRKGIHGTAILKENGMRVLLDKCPHFKVWVETLTKALKRPPVSDR